MNILAIAYIFFLMPTRIDSCRICHGGETFSYEKSVHAHLFSCKECHGGDPADMKKTAMSPLKGFRKLKNKREIAIICSKCHSDVEKMLPYGKFIDELRIYKTSKHGISLFEKGDEKVAVCTDCHGVHDIKRVNDPFSSVYPFNIPFTCARCHADKEYMRDYKIPTDQFEKYRSSIHGKLRLENKDMRAPACPDCHGVHGALPPQTKNIHQVCGKCHEAQKLYYEKSIHKDVEGFSECASCHGYHDVSKPRYQIFISESGCLKCHEKGSSPAKLAEEMMNMFVEAENSINSTIALIEKARTKGFEVEEETIKLKEAKGWIIEGLTVVHSLNLQEVRDYCQNAIVISSDIMELVRLKLIEWRDRRVMLIINIFIFMLTAFLLILKRKSIKGGQDV